MRWSRRIWTFVVLVIVPVVFVTGCWIKQDLEEKSWYRQHELVRIIREENSLEVRRQAVLAKIPLGTSQSETLHKLALETFTCKNWNASPPKSKTAYDCYLDAKPDYVAKWLVQVYFDEEQRLIDANVRALK